jgi:hypothetical protein
VNGAHKPQAIPNASMHRQTVKTKSVDRNIVQTPLLVAASDQTLFAHDS